MTLSCVFYRLVLLLAGCGSQSDEGQTLVEYALIITLVALVVVSALTAFGVGLNGLISPVTGAF